MKAGFEVFLLLGLFGVFFLPFYLNPTPTHQSLMSFLAGFWIKNFIFLLKYSHIC